MNDVHPLAFRLVFDLATTLSLDADALATRAGTSRDALAAGGGSWSDYAGLCDHFMEVLGGPDACRLAGRRLNQATPYADWIFGSVLDPADLLRIAIRLDRRLWPGLIMELHPLDDGRWVFKGRLPPRLRPCLTWFAVSAGAMETLPHRIGLPDAEVEADYGPAHGTYVLRLPESRAVTRRLRRNVASGWRWIDELFTERRAEQRARQAARLEAHGLRWNLTPLQRLVLEQLVQGLPDREIARGLGCAEATVRAEVTEIHLRSGIEGRQALIAHFWSSEA